MRRAGFRARAVGGTPWARAEMLRRAQFVSNTRCDPRRNAGIG